MRRGWMAGWAAVAAIVAGLLGPASAGADRYVLGTNIASEDVSIFTGAPGGALTPFAGSPFDLDFLPGPITISPDGRFAFVIDLDGETVSAYRVEDTGPVPVNTVPSDGPVPSDLVVTPDGTRLLVFNADEDLGPDANVAVFDIDQSTGALTAVGPGQDPGVAFAHTGAVSPDGRFVYVLGCEEDAQQCTAINVAQLEIGQDGTLEPIAAPLELTGVGSPATLTATSDGSRMFVLGLGSESVAQPLDVDEASGTLSKGDNFATLLGFPASGLAATPDGEFIFITSEEPGGISTWVLVDGELEPVDELDTPGIPRSIALAPGGETLYTMEEGMTYAIGAYAIGAGGELTAVPDSPFPTGGIGASPDSLAITPTQTPQAALSVDTSGVQAALTPQLHAQVAPGAAVRFDASASSVAGGFVTSYDWDFGDGTQLPDGGPTPMHTYTAPGTYEVTVTVTNDCDPDAPFAAGVVSVGTTILCNGPRTATAGATVSVESPAPPPPPPPPPPATPSAPPAAVPPATTPPAAPSVIPVGPPPARPRPGRARVGITNGLARVPVRGRPRRPAPFTGAARLGTVTVRLRCRAVRTRRCRGTVVVRRRGKALTSMRAFDIRRGGVRTVRLRLRASVQRRLAKVKKLRARTVARTRQPGGGRPWRTSRRIVLRADVR